MNLLNKIKENTALRSIFIVVITGMSFPVTGIIILLVGGNPLQAFTALLEGSFGSGRALTETVLLATPLLLIGLGLVLAFRCQTWNIGAEGQYIIGGLGAIWVGLTWGSSLPSIILIPIMLLMGLVGGASWATIPGILKAKLGISEIVVSLMLNFVAFFGLSYIVRVPLKNPDYYLPQTAQLGMAARLPKILDSRIHIGVLIALLGVAFVNFILWRTTFGYELRAVGENAVAAQSAGIKVDRSIISVMAFSGAFAGLAGAIQIMGVYFYAAQGLSADYGYTAVLIAILGQLNPLGVLLASFLFSSLVIGADFMHRAAGLQQALVHFIQATIVIFYLIANAVMRRRD